MLNNKTTTYSTSESTSIAIIIYKRLTENGMLVSDILRKENNNFDLIRICCATMVIIGHCYKLHVPIGKTDLVEALTNFTYSGALAVKIFFFISGLLVTDSLIKKRSVVSFIISRGFRLLPGLSFELMVTTFIICPFLTTIGAINFLSNPSIYLYVIKNIVFNTTNILPGIFINNYHSGNVNGSIWTLHYEVKFYFFLLCAFIILKNNKLLQTIIAISVIFYSFFHLNILGKDPGPEISLLPFSFALGALLAIYKDKIKINYLTFLVLAIITTIAWHSFLNESFFILTVFTFVLLLGKDKYFKNIKIKHDISYGIYLWGFFIQQTILMFFPSINFYIFMLLSISLSIFWGFISFYFIEKKFMKIGKDLDRNINSRYFSN